QFVPLGPTARTLAAALMISVVGAVNVRGTRHSASVQNWSTGIKVAAILAMSVVLLGSGHGLPELRSATFTARLGPSLLSGAGIARTGRRYADRRRRAGRDVQCRERSHPDELAGVLRDGAGRGVLPEAGGNPSALRHAGILGARKLGVGHRARGHGQLRAAVHIRDLRGVGLLCAGRSQRLRVAAAPSGRSPAVPRPRVPVDAARVRRLGRGDCAQHDLGAPAALAARARRRGTRSARLPRLAAGPGPGGRRVSGFKFPHPLVLLVAGIALAAAASWVLPAGQDARPDDPATGRRVVIAGTYHAVPPHPVGPLWALVAIPKGMVDAASVIFFVFLIGGAFTVVDRTGALREAVEWLVRRLARRDALVIPATCLVFALGGVLDNMKEEIIALVPVMLLLVRRLG